MPCTIIFPICFFQNLLCRVQFDHSLVFYISSYVVQLVVTVRRIPEKRVIIKDVPVVHCNQSSKTRTKFRRAVRNRLIFIVCRFQELKAIEQLVSLLNEQPEEVMLKRSLAWF